MFNIWSRYLQLFYLINRRDKNIIWNQSKDYYQTDKK